MSFFNSLILKVAHAQGGEVVITLPNPLAPASNLFELLTAIINALRVYIAPPILGLVVMYGAFQMLFAAGDPTKFAIGKKTILYAVIGYAIILIANGVALIIQDLVQ